MKKIITKRLQTCRKALAGILLLGYTCGFCSAQNWEEMTSTIISNPGYTSGTSASCNWNDGTVNPTISLTYTNAELYQKSGTVAQQVSSTRVGKYKLTVQGYHRAKANDAGAAYTAGTEVINAYLFADENEVAFKSLYSESPSLSTVGAYSNGYPNSMQAAQAYFNLGDTMYLNELEFISSGDMLIGINSKTTTSGSWTCWSNFKLYYDTTSENIDIYLTLFDNYITEGHTLYDTLSVLGFDMSSMLDQVIAAEAFDTTSVYEEVKAAFVSLQTLVAKANTVLNNYATLKADIEEADLLYTSLTNGTYYATDATKQALDSILTVAKTVFAYTNIEQTANSIEDVITNLNTAISNVNKSISLTFPLTSAKNLADKIGGLESTTEYLAVVADLSNSDVDFDDILLDVQALNAVCKEAMTTDFLNTASDDDPIELTSFITNPNIYQSGEITAAPSGWTCDRGTADKTSLTAAAYGDSYLYCYSWSGNASHNIGYSHYYQAIGIDEEGSVSLPDGLYSLKAATYSTNSSNILLYASSDSTNFNTTTFNGDLTLFTEAEDAMATTTELLNIEVSNGKLYLGVKGDKIDLGGYIGGTGKYWNADNFRLYYVGSSVVSVYQERLRALVTTALEYHNSLVEYGIDDTDDLAWYLGEDSVYITSEDIASIKQAIEDLTEMADYASTIITNYETLVSLVTTGEVLYNQLENGVIAAQPTVKATFETALVAAEDRGVSNLSWDNVLNKFADLSTDLNSAITDLTTSVAMCYPLAKAKVLAEKIGGLGTNEAYTKVVADLNNDELETVDADMDVLELNAVCLAAMTEDVKQTASKTNAFDLTSFIVNPNIFQNSTDSTTGSAINTTITGWTCTTNADGTARTAATSGDTYLYCYSWSGHSTHNISYGTNYYQLVGGDEEGKVALPNGIYTLAAATYSKTGSSNLCLYAMTSDSVYSTTLFNGDEDSWDIAQSYVDTTTNVTSIYVTDGVLTIGVKGVDDAITGGNGASWTADNFRLYYVGANTGDGINQTKINESAEFVDVYDLMGRCIRKGVKTSEATQGLEKGLYIVGKEKIMIIY